MALVVPDVIHAMANSNVKCDGCNRDVQGIHFRCLQCKDLVYCTLCQGGRTHSHAASVARSLSVKSAVGAMALVVPDVIHATSHPFAEDPFTSRWSPEQKEVPFRRAIVDRSDQEYKTVIANMMSHGGENWTEKVKLVCRIENHLMYKIYKSHREAMEKKIGPGFQIERILWHGTSADVLSNIYTDGFNRGYCGKNAAAYGDGVYFATMFDYSASQIYAPPDSNGQKFIFQCRVLTGQFTQGQEGIKEPPKRTRELRYDSVVDNMANPTMFVIFKDMQVYPEYVITLQV